MSIQAIDDWERKCSFKELKELAAHTRGSALLTSSETYRTWCIYLLELLVILAVRKAELEPSKEE